MGVELLIGLGLLIGLSVFIFLILRDEDLFLITFVSCGNILAFFRIFPSWSVVIFELLVVVLIYIKWKWA